MFRKVMNELNRSEIYVLQIMFKRKITVRMA